MTKYLVSKLTFSYEAKHLGSKINIFSKKDNHVPCYLILYMIFRSKEKI